MACGCAGSTRPERQQSQQTQRQGQVAPRRQEQIKAFGQDPGDFWRGPKRAVKK